MLYALVVLLLVLVLLVVFTTSIRLDNNTISKTNSNVILYINIIIGILYQDSLLDNRPLSNAYSNNNMNNNTTNTMNNNNSNTKMKGAITTNTNIVVGSKVISSSSNNFDTASLQSQDDTTR